VKIEGGPRVLVVIPHSGKEQGMRRIFPFVLLAAALAAPLGCGDGAGDGGSDSGTDTGTDTDTDTDTDLSLSGVDLLIVADNSNSMAQEQAILGNGLYGFVGALLDPLPTADLAAIDDLRVAVVTSNMGFSSDGVDNDEFWPTSVPPQCAGFGDDGAFQTIDVSSLSIANDVVPCDETAVQCPPGWTCANLDGDGAGVCHTGGETTIGCPSQSAPWVETTPDDPDPNLAARAACLSVQGTAGCGFEQQLAAATTSLTRDDQSAFLRDGSLLIVLVMSDEEDCSMENGEGLFGEEEIQNQGLQQVNIACGNHPQYLYTPSDFYDFYTSIKPAGAVFFAAIVGVPYGTQTGAAECEGFGDEIGDCLVQPEMDLVPEQPDGGVEWYFHPACTRTEDAVEVTRAYPGRRYVQLANENFESMGYVYSICNADWTPAFQAISAKIGEILAP
jgi:hypothetical protein